MIFSIESARPEDAGTYSVVVANKLGDVTGIAKVHVEPKDKKPAFVKDLQDTKVVEGFPIKLEVKVIGHPQPEIQWMRNGEVLKTDGKRCVITDLPDGTSTLFIEEATPADAGEYRVVATNEKGVISSKGNLQVIPRAQEGEPEEPPRFLTGLRDVNTDEGKELTLSATFVGNPIPEIYWTKDGKPLHPSDRVLMTCDGKHVGLSINPAEVIDSGDYQCLLANPLGEDTSRCSGNVRKVYQKPHFSQKLTDMQQIESYDAKLPVRVAGVPHPDLTWYFNDEPIRDSNKYKIKVSVYKAII